jgi:predicted RND superfamily exporter protein
LITKVLTKKNAIVTLVIFCLTTFFSLPLVFTAEPHYSFEEFIPENSPYLENYNDFLNTFGVEHEFMVIGVQPKKENIFSSNFYNTLDSITTQLKSIEFINEVQSPLQLKIPRKVGGQIFQVPFLSGNDFELDSLKVLNEPGLARQFFAKELNAVLIRVQNEENLSRKKSDALYYDLQMVTAQFDEKVNFYLAGRIPGQYVLLNELEKQLKLFAPFAFIVLCVILWLSFRTIWGVWAPMLVVAAAAAWLVAILEISGQKLNVLNVLLPTILLVVGTSDTVHLTSRYYELFRKTNHKLTALSLAIKEVGLATLLTTITTAIGFLALMVSPVKPVKEFGLYAAIGVVIAYIISFTAYPAVLLLLPAPVNAIKNNDKFKWNKLTAGLFKFSFNNAKRIVFISILLLIGGFYAAFKLEVNNYLLDDLRPSHPAKKEYSFFEKNFNGSRPLEWIIKGKENIELNAQNLRWANSFQTQLKEKYQTRNIISPVSVFKELNRVQQGGDNNFYSIPDSEESLKKVLPYFKQIPSKQKKQVINENFWRFSGLIGDIGSKRGAEIESEISSWVKENPPPFTADIYATGVAPIIDKSNSVLAESILHSLTLAFLAVGILMALIFKDYLMLPIAFIANALPLATICLFMYAFGLELKISTGLIFSVAFGIAVDDTIHFLSKYLLEKRSGRKTISALKRTMRHAGKAILITTLLLIGGFSTLLFSVFGSTFNLGLFLSFTLVLAVFSDLMLLPILIRATEKLRR